MLEVPARMTLAVPYVELSGHQTSLFGYDKSKPYQVNTLRGKQIIVIREDCPMRVLSPPSAIPIAMMLPPAPSPHNHSPVDICPKEYCDDTSSYNTFHMCESLTETASFSTMNSSPDEDSHSLEPGSIPECSSNVDSSSNLKDHEDYCADNTYCEVFWKSKCRSEEDERRDLLQWYDELLQWRHDAVMGRRFGPPSCHPPPPSKSMLKASRTYKNPFEQSRSIHPFTLDIIEYNKKKAAKQADKLIAHNLPLPPPHTFMRNISDMLPHDYVEYCYKLTAAAYIDSGFNPPNRKPPIPPQLEALTRGTATTNEDLYYSSPSEVSSDGEYSDESETSKNERLKQKSERHRMRANRLQRILQRRGISVEQIEADSQKLIEELNERKEHEEAADALAKKLILANEVAEEADDEQNADDEAEAIKE